jgi:hypothetical protein
VLVLDQHLYRFSIWSSLAVAVVVLHKEPLVVEVVEVLAVIAHLLLEKTLVVELQLNLL